MHGTAQRRLSKMFFIIIIIILIIKPHPHTDPLRRLLYISCLLYWSTLAFLLSSIKAEPRHLSLTLH